MKPLSILNICLIFLSLPFVFAQSIEEEVKENSPNDEKTQILKEIEELNKKKESLQKKFKKLDKESKKEEDFFKLEETIVTTASKKEQKISEAPAAVYIVTEKQIRTRGYRTLVDALHDIPGFDFQHTYGVYPELVHQRGFIGENNRTLIYIDGIPDNNMNDFIPYGGMRFPLDNVERIEIVSGPASALYGANAFNGIINVITKDGKTNPGNHVSGTYGVWEKKGTNPGASMSFSTRGKVGVGEDSMTYSVGGYYYKTDGPNLGKANRLEKPNYDPNDAIYGMESKLCGGVCIPTDKSVGRYWSPTYNNSKEDTYNLTAQFTRGNFRFQTVNWQYLQGEGTFGNGTNQIDTYQRGLETDNFDTRNNIRRIGIATGVASPKGFPGSNWDTRSNSLRLGYLYKFSPKLNLDSELVTRSTQLLSSSGESYPNTTDTGAYYRTGDFTTADKYSRPDYGYQLEEKLQFEPNSRLSSTIGIIGRHFVLPKDFGSQERITYNTYGAYVQQVFKLGSTLSLTGGYRYDINTLYGKASTPRFSIIWKILPDLTLKFLIGTGFREPTVKELFGFTAQRKQNPDLQPEHLKSYEAGIAYRFLKRFYISTHGYYNKITNLILETTTRDSNPINGISPSGGAWQQNQNSGDARVYALESSFDFQITQNLGINFNHTFSRGFYENLPRVQSTSPSTQGRLGDNLLEDFYLQSFKEATNVTIIPSKGQIPNIPEHKANFGFTWFIIEDISFYLGMNYIDIRRTRSTNPEKTIEGYTMLKTNIRWENFFTKGMFLQLHINNFGNEQFYDPGIRAANGYYYPTRHPLETRNFWLTIGYHF